ncbi:ABC transporter ATP-binding protein [Desulfovibrio inopinatus]|uniref:ABC transporter ATP-binding protein n=1 Tax=Desulfovibrio inopinatus TaxID=102109 RepID=UPI000421D137|nr:ABC transporter ATP-binding protein [Desulfovibrio inopinatus]
MMSLKNVHLTLSSPAGRVNILRGVDFQVEHGDIVAIAGPSGAGKTTLLMLMAGLEKATSGEVVAAGMHLDTLNEDALATFRRDNVGIVFQSFHLAPSMTALENVALPLELAYTTDAFEQAQKALDAVGLGSRLTHYPSQLSGGEQQRVALARAFAGQPKLILADEPTGNLDAATGETVMNLLFDLAQRIAATLILITHDNTLAKRCHRIVHMRDGRLEEHSSNHPSEYMEASLT